MERAAIILSCLLCVYNSYAAELHTVSDSRFLTDGDTLVSAAGIFELGFFKPDSSENRYLGIWYKNISVRAVVWVANRDHPLPNASRAVLKIDDQGILGVFNNSSMIWSSNATTSGNATAKLQDNGNLVVVDQDMKIIWQSFDYPTDTLLPGMKLGKDLLRSKEWHISSWKSSQDPAPGEWTWGADTLGYPENKLKHGSIVIFRGRPWTNRRLGWISVSNKGLTLTYDVIINEDELSFAYNIVDSNILARIKLSANGDLESDAWEEDSRRWRLLQSFATRICDPFNLCGTYGTCSVDKTARCTCLDEKRFVPKNQKSWDAGDWSGGCIRRTTLECKNGSDVFIKYSNVKLPDTEKTWFNRSVTLEECETKCLKNCSCMAYANPDSNQTVCLLWFNDLLDIQVLPEGSDPGGDIFVRMASSVSGSQSISKKQQGGANIKIILLVIFPGIILIGIMSAWLCYAPRKRNNAELTPEGDILNVSIRQEKDMEQPFFSFSTIANATANFSHDNKLGEGGFGPVYKGMLEGQEIAVKRLSKNSSQGHNEFKNEVICISKLQHRNLVKILGCCIEGDEKLLIYEYMPNKSLDSFIFDETQSILLDWTKRFNIIKGIARGLVYLHHDSRLRIIHRDLKASNILLNQDMNPKISDFGLARSFGGNETQANTERVVGTYGYMSPEYALDGLFSIKSDVFSFGILVLETVSGKRNRGFEQSENERRSMDLVDSSCIESCQPDEVIRSIKVGLLCVQHNAGDRPHMSSVISMLGGEGEPPQPKQPSFFMQRQLRVANVSSSTYTEDSVNDCTISVVNAR